MFFKAQSFGWFKVSPVASHSSTPLCKQTHIIMVTWLPIKL